MEEHELASQFQLTVTLADGIDVIEGARRLDAEIARFLQSGPSDDELERVRMGRYAAFVRGIERVGGFTGKTAVLAEGWLDADDPAFYRTQLQWMREAAAADVTRAPPASGSGAVTTRSTCSRLAISSHPAAAPTAARSRSSHRHRSSRFQRSRRDSCTSARRSGSRGASERRASCRGAGAVSNGGYVADVGRPQGLSSFANAMLDEGTTCAERARDRG